MDCGVNGKDYLKRLSVEHFGVEKSAMHLILGVASWTFGIPPNKRLVHIYQTEEGIDNR
jgi:hypothetical protein